MAATSTPNPAQTPLQNMYYKRPVGTPKPCTMQASTTLITNVASQLTFYGIIASRCYRETRTVLWNPQDFIYTCDAHLTDPGFATAVEPEATTTKVVLGEEELNRIKAEWGESQRKKKEKEEAAAKEKEKAKEKEGGSGILGWLGSGSSNAPSSTSTADNANKTPLAALFASPNSSPAAHQRFILNRQIFAMRQAELRKKRQASRVNALAPRLPGVPRNL